MFMRFVESANFPLLLGSAIVFPTVLLGYFCWVSAPPLVGLLILGVLLMMDGVIWERLFGFEGPMAEDLLIHSFRWAKRRYVAALILSCLAGIILYIYGADAWQTVVALVGPSVIYASLLVFDIIRAMKTVDERVR